MPMSASPLIRLLRFLGKVQFTMVLLLGGVLIMTDMPEPAGEPGTVYLILGSDTGTWDGMNVSQYENYYRFGN